MNFDKNRLMELSGLPVEAESGVLTEGKSLTTESRRDMLAETKLRAAIRKEIADILESLDESEGNTQWMHRSLGQPKASQTGRVTRGFFGLGFK